MKLRDHVLEVLHTLRPLGAIKARYCQRGRAVLIHKDRVFGVIADSGLYIKTDKHTENEFDKWNAPRLAKQWNMHNLGIDLPFRRLPEGAQHCSEAMIAWARLGIEAADRETTSAGE